MLNPTTILIKTVKGEEEIRSGEHDIMPDQRIALSFIDGKSNISKLIKKAAPSLRSSLPKLLESLSIEGFARDISQPENNKGKLKIAIPQGKAATDKINKNLNSSNSFSKYTLATGLSNQPSARARERGEDIGAWTASTTGTPGAPSARARERGEDIGAWTSALAGFEADALAKKNAKKPPVNDKVAKQKRVWEKAEIEEEARLWAEAAAKTESKAKAEAEAKAKAEAEAKAKAEAEAKAKAKAKAEAEAKAKAEAEAKAKAEAEAKAKAEAEAKAKAEAEAKAKAEAEAKAKAEAEAKAKAKAKAEAEAKAKAEAEAKAKAEAEAKAKAEAEAKAKAEAEAKAKAEAEAKAKAEAEAKAKAKAKAEAEAKAKAEAEAKAKAEAEAKAKAEAEAKAKAEAEAKAKAEAEAKAKAEAEAKAKAEAEAKAKAELAAKAAAEAEEEAKARAEAAVKAEEEAKVRAEAAARAEEEAKAKAEAASKAGEEAKVKAELAAEAEEEAKAKAKSAARAEEEANAKLETNVEDEVKVKAEEEARLWAEAATKAEEEAKVKAESAARAEEEANAKVEEEASAKVESAAKAKEKAKAKAESAARAEEEANAKAESATKAEEEAIAKSETDAEEDVKTKAEEEANAKAKAAAKAEEEAKVKAESAARAEEEAKTKAESASKAEVESKARAEAIAKEKEEEKSELKTSRKKGKKNRSRAKAKEKAGNKSQEEENNEAKIISASEDYAKAIASAMAEIETKPNKNITSDTKEKTISGAESLPNLDLSAFKSDDIKETIEEDTEIAEITSEAEEGVQRKINTRNETLITENEIWQEEETEVQAATIPSLRHRRKPINLSLVVPLLFVAFICVTLILPYVLPTSQYISTIEKSATDSISEPVKIGSLHVTFLPIPSVEASAVTIGSNIKIKSAILTFSMFSSFNSNNLKIIELRGVSILPGAYDNITRWSRLSNAPQLSELKRIELKETKLEFKNISVPILSGSVTLTDNNKFSGASFTTNDKRININISPGQNNYLLNISAKEWKPSLSSPMVLSDLDAKVIMSTGLFQINEIDGRIYDGVLKGTASAKWKEKWSLDGKLEIERVNIKEAAISYNTDIPMEGKLFSRVEISSEAREFEQLYDAMHINGTFQLQNGFVKIDLGNSIRTTSKGSIASGQTRFDELSGILKVIDKSYQLKQLKLSSGILSAEGTLDIVTGEKLSGEIISNLKGGHTMSSGPISLEGTIKDPLLVRY